MIAPQKKVKSKKNVEVSQQTPVPVVAPVIIEQPKKPSYRQKLIERIGLDAVREKERLSRQATKEKKMGLVGLVMPVS